MLVRDQPPAPPLPLVCDLGHATRRHGPGVSGTEVANDHSPVGVLARAGPVGLRWLARPHGPGTRQPTRRVRCRRGHPVAAPPGPARRVGTGGVHRRGGAGRRDRGGGLRTGCRRPPPARPPAGRRRGRAADGRDRAPHRGRHRALPPRRRSPRRGRARPPPGDVVRRPPLGAGGGDRDRRHRHPGGTPVLARRPRLHRPARHRAVRRRRRSRRPGAVGVVPADGRAAPATQPDPPRRCGAARRGTRPGAGRPGRRRGDGQRRVRAGVLGAGRPGGQRGRACAPGRTATRPATPPTDGTTGPAAGLSRHR